MQVLAETGRSRLVAFDQIDKVCACPRTAFHVEKSTTPHWLMDVHWQLQLW